MPPANDENIVAQASVSESMLWELADETLVQLCKVRKSKDQRPFTALFRRYQGYVWQICYRFIQNPQGAEDLMQEVFFKVYRGLDQFEGRSSFKTWLGRIATNTCLNELRRQERRPRIHPGPLEIFAEFIPSEDVADPSWVNTPGPAFLMRAMMRLRSDDLEVIQMKELDEMTYNEIAQMLKISLSAAKMRVHRARLALQLAYDKEKELEVS